MSKMRNLTLVLVVAAVVVAGPSSLRPVDDAKAIEEAVLKTHIEMIQAANNLDADKFLSYILDVEQVRIIQDGVLLKTKQEISNVIAKGFEGAASVERNFEYPAVAVLSPTTAVVTGAGMATVTTRSGRTISSRFATSEVFVLTDGQWKILSGHYSLPNPR